MSVKNAEPPAVMQVESRHGALRVLRSDKPISEALDKYGEWAQIEIDFLAQFLTGCEVILDVGSHVGVHACAWAQLAPKAIVHAFEPQPQLYDLLTQNVAPWAGRVQTHCTAVGAVAGPGYVLPIDGRNPVNAGAGRVHSNQTSGALEVRVVRLDDLQFGGAVGFVKLDIEGQEAEGLAGAAALISRFRPVIFCEVNSVESGVAVLAAMSAFPYDVYLIATAAFNPDHAGASHANMFGHAHETALVFVPEGRPVPEQRRATVLHKVTSVDDFAATLLSVPRYGDETDFDRNAAALRLKVSALGEEALAARKRQEQADLALSNALAKSNDRDALDAALKEAKRDNIALQKAKFELQQVNIELQRAKSELQQTNAELQQAYNVSQAAHASVRAALDAATAAKDQLARDLERATSDALAHRARLDATEARMSKLLGELSESRGELARVSRDLRSEQDNARALRADLAASQRACADRQRDLARSAATIEAIEKRFDALRSSLKAEQARLAGIRTELLQERNAHNNTRAAVDIEKARRAAVLDLLGPADVPAAADGMLGAIVKRFGRGKLVSAIRELESSALFDADWYRTTYSGSLKGLAPAAHYLLHGGYEGRNPSPRFEGENYLRINPDVRASGMSPLLHYARWGARELRKYQPEAPSAAPNDAVQATLWERPQAPPFDHFRRIAENRAGVAATPLVDVIVPVYRSYDDTLACLASVLESRNATPYELVVIDDASPEPELSAALEELADLGLITLVKNATNRGFVGTVNRGMRLHPRRDVLLLNSDTLVFNDWLDRIRAHTARNANVASVTPFTNNGTICSYPKFCNDNNEALELPFDELDRLIAATNAGRSIDVPTGVGFCMYLTRSALDRFGLFDEETFGRGYGEENDFCMRAMAGGYRNLHALDAFVFHSGETSFAETAHEGKRRGLALVNQKHPGYDATVHAFLRRDPARAARIAADVARLLGRAPQRTTLCFSHLSGGGIERYLRDYRDRLLTEGRDIVVFVPASAGKLIGRLTTVGATNKPANLDGIDIVNDAEVLRQALEILCVDRLEVHSTVGWSYKVPVMIERLSKVCGVDYTVMLHDYVALCPQINLINESGAYCGEEGTGQCQRCLSLATHQPRAVHPDVPDPTRINISVWRQMYGDLLRGAAGIAAPSADTAARFGRHFPALKITVAPHAENPQVVANARVAAPAGTRPVRVGVIGAIGPHKGSRVLLACANDAKRRALPLEFLVLGYSDIDGELRDADVTITGRYDESDIGALMSRHPLDIAFLPSVWPETYCYTLSIALAASLPICVFDLGAQGERAKQANAHLLLPLELLHDIASINDRLIQFAKSATADA